MNRYRRYRNFSRQLLGFALAAGAVLPFPSEAAYVALVNQPMATTTASNVKPNVMFILDDSGSMASNYLPDWANSGSANLFQNSAYNGLYYSPDILYLPPVYYNADGSLNTTTYPSQTGGSTATGADATTKPNWNAVKNDAYGILTTGTSNLVGNASYYTILPGEYCTASDLKACVAAAAPSGTYPFPAPLRWCSSAANASAATPTAGTCQAIRISPYTNARYPQFRTATITVNTPTTTATSVTSIIVGGSQILSAATAASTNRNTVAANIAAGINACSSVAYGSCTTSGFSATVSSSTVTITPNVAGAVSTPSVTSSGSMVITPSAFSGGNSVPGSIRFVTIIPTNSSYPYPGSATKASGRTDCAGTTCTYAEEMTNYANWWTYYQTRIQSMKTSVSRAFKALDSRFRVGYTTISDTGVTNGTTFLGVGTFELAQKNTWFNKFFAAQASPYTPLRGAISKAGRYYAHVAPYKTGVDPVQYSCQQNFTILSTDGYWNTNDETSTYGPFNLAGGNVGDLDGGTTPRPMHEGTTAVSNTLADVSKYYYDTDLRTSALGNCAGASSTDYPSGNPDVCSNNVFTSSTDTNAQQHMTTFTMGLGADGALNFTTDYDTATSGDFYNLKNGLGSPTVNWPDPIANSAEARIDDLWHAAVNGRGLYFSAKSPDQIVNGFTKALSSITAKIGSAAAAATSTLTPVAGNNFAYVASYTTGVWKGNLEARTIDISTGVVSDTASWCVENVLASTCATPLVADTSGSSTIYNCVTTGATALTCTSPSVFDSLAGTCATQVANSCIGTMAAKVNTVSDTRSIYTANNAGTALIPFDSAYASAHLAYFSPPLITGLNQWGTLSPAQQTAAAGANLVNYLRGQNGYEMRAANLAANQLFRAREATMGDALESQPVYYSAPVFNYTYPGYAAYQSAQSGRLGNVYMGTNDGMLHAFDANTGVERWAYVPSMVIPNMWKLASTDYSTNHVNFVNGSAIIADIYSSVTSSWRTILIGGLNGGGRGYYALDVTDPVTPSLLWEFTPGKAAPYGDPDLGYSYGRAVVTRMANGTWVALVTTGYDNGALSSKSAVNNTPPGSGLGSLYVINASTGALVSKISTTAGSAAAPSGLAQIVAWNNVTVGNEAGSVYGGDLAGNLWRFDINVGTSSLFATLTDGFSPQPVTTKPVLGMVSDQHVVFVGTGKYLEASDLTNTQKQSLYAIKDDGTAVGDPRTHTGTDKMVQQTIIQSAGSSLRTESLLTLKTVDFNSDRGWFVDFPDVFSTGSERVNIDFQLVAGTLIVPTIVPASTACSPGGYGWLSYFNYENGGPVGSGNSTVSVKFDSSIVGVNIIYINSKPVVEVVTASNPTPSIPTVSPNFNIPSSKYYGQRSIWRELK